MNLNYDFTNFTNLVLYKLDSFIGYKTRTPSLFPSHQRT